MQSIAGISEGEVVSIDGKRMYNSGEGGKKAIIHMVSAWSNTNSLVPGQLKVNDKSNEITAIPALLDLFHLYFYFSLSSITTITACCVTHFYCNKHIGKLQ